MTRAHRIVRLLQLALRALPPALALGVLPAASAAGLRAVYDVTRTTERTEGAGAPSEVVKHVVRTVRLAPGGFAVREGDDERGYDFIARRLLIVDHAKHELRSTALYSFPALLEAELRNRQMLSRMLAVAGKQFDPVNAEIELAMTADPPAKAQLSERTADGTRVFAINGREVTHFAPADTRLPPELRAHAAHLLLYEARLHPLVYAALVADPRLPRRIVFVVPQLGEQKTETWELREAVEEPFDLASVGAGSSPAADPAHPLPALASAVRDGSAGTPPAVATYRERAEHLLGSGRPFECFLVAMELSFATLEPPPDLIKRCHTAAARDPRMQALDRVLKLPQRDPKAALAALDTIDATGLEGSAALSVLRANQLIDLHDGNEALEAFSHALMINPFLIGPWSDAGRLYFERYDTFTAWVCWDAAHTLAHHRAGLIKQVDDLETHLLRRYPQFF